jgi:fructose-bisphosphate aldolase / 2-amino-3,7-dideoxy-D-threo-hept-6-ulosonate synthase
MISTGRARRLARIQNQTTGRMAILPLDLVMPLGPVPGAADQLPLIRMAGVVGVDAVLLRWGEARRCARDLSPDVGLIIRISGAAQSGADGYEGLLHSVEASLALGADGVCVDLRLGDRYELQMMQGVAAVAESCDRLGVVCLVEAVPTGSADDGDRQAGIAWAARVAQELGADIVKVPHPGGTAAMRAVAEQCQVPLVVAGGSRVELPDLLHSVQAALTGGASGTAIGRNVITSADPAAVQRAILEMVHEHKPAEQALRELLATIGT